MMGDYDFLIRAGLAAVAVALTAGPLGCFVVWRRMAYFGDALAHASLLGLALGFILKIDLMIGVLAGGLLFALLLFLLERQKRLSSDTILGILAHAALAFGLCALALAPALKVDLQSLLFGDVLSVTFEDVLWVWGGGLFVILSLAQLWRPLLAVTAHEELARIDGVAVERTKLLFLMLMALTVALAMKVVGVLLMTALLVIPPAAARSFARSPEQMAVIAACIGLVSVLAGLYASLMIDLPAGPAIIVAATMVFAGSMAVRRS
ncbi:MAG: iron chelate uptake ABC transporter family permease subunit [Rhodospirillales bacterium]|jgi:zinc transport system permease protein